MSLTPASGATATQVLYGSSGSAMLRRAVRLVLQLAVAYLLLLAVHAYLGRWTPDYLQGRDLWHFMLTRMVVPLVMLAAFTAFTRLLPAAVLLSALLLFIGTISAIKRDSTGEPFQVSDLFLAGQSSHLLGYVSWDRWFVAAALVPAIYYFLRNLRFRWWSLPLFACSVALLSTYRLEPVVAWIHDHGPRIGVENLTFSQAESERMNGISTHLYFSTAGLRLKTFTTQEVEAAVASLDRNDPPAMVLGPHPDVYIVLGEAWWRDPSDKASPINKLVAAGFSEGQGISPVYGGTTPNAEFEVLTSVPVHSFQPGIIPYQHYQPYLSTASRTLPRLLKEKGYEARAFHNFTPRFWLRDKVYPRLGFESFASIDDMKVEMQPNGWPKDAALYAKALSSPLGDAPQFNFLVTVSTHGPFAEDKQKDMINGVFHPGITEYHNRLGSAVDALIDFNAELKRRGRPYVLLVFGDHLPGLRLHQWKMGMKSESDPRLHQVPILVASNAGSASALIRKLDQKPFYCIMPLLTNWLKLGIDDAYVLHLAKSCSDESYAGETPREAVIQNQIFSDRPIR